MFTEPSSDSTSGDKAAMWDGMSIRHSRGISRSTKTHTRFFDAGLPKGIVNRLNNLQSTNVGLFNDAARPNGLLYTGDENMSMGHDDSNFNEHFDVTEK